jgi:hypothetical protein
LGKGYTKIVKNFFLDVIKLSFGDFVVHRLIYKDLSWIQAKHSCKKLNGRLPYFNSLEDLKSELKKYLP